jgi:hypothetical protein
MAMSARCSSSSASRPCAPETTRPHAGFDVEVDVLDPERRVQRELQLSRHQVRRRHVDDGRQEDRELVSAEPRDRVDVP